MRGTPLRSIVTFTLTASWAAVGCAMSAVGDGDESVAAAGASLAACEGTSWDPSSCGDCGVACADDEMCIAGVCVSSSAVRSETIVGAESLLDYGVWYERGPELGGRIDGLVTTNTSDPTLIVGAAGGGVWRRLESGSTWNFVSWSGFGDHTVMHLEWDAVTSGRLYALTWNRLAASSDYGSTWTGLVNPGGTPATLLPAQTELADPKPFAQLKFTSTQAAVFASYGCRGIYYSFDGVNFTQHYPFTGGSSNPDNCIGNIAPDPVSRRVYFSTLHAVPGQPAHVYRSTCAWSYGTPCLTWQSANGGLPTGARVSAVTSVSYGVFADDLVALIRSGTTTNTYGTFDGSSWSLSSSLASQWTPRPLVYVGANELFHGNVNAQHTLGLGSSWSSFVVPSEHVDVRAIFPNPVLARVYTANDGTGNAGAQWNITRWNWTPDSPPTSGSGIGHSGLRIWQAYYAGAVPRSAPSAPTRVFLGSQDNGAVCSDVAGPGWGTSGAPSGGDAIAIQFAPSNANRAYARSNSGTTFQRSGNAQAASSCLSVSWTTVTPPGGTAPPSYWSRKIIGVHPGEWDTVMFVNATNVAASINGGSCFTTSSLPGGALPLVVQIESCGYRCMRAHVGTSGAGAYEATYNGGACTGSCPCGTWSSWSTWGLNSTPPAMVMGIASSGGASPTYWMATTNGLYRKLSGGSWTLVTGGGGYVVNDVAVDPSCPTRVYAAFGFGGARIQHRGGIQVSTDNGTTWDSITSGFDIHQTPVTDIEIDNVDPELVYASSYGHGFWLYDWGAALPVCVS